MNNELIVNTIRCLAADVVQNANSGHPGAPMGMAAIAHVLWRKFLKVAPSHPQWANRDRVVLENGHACALLYIMLHLNGYPMSMQDLKSFRQLHSKTPGHPEFGHTEGVDITSGPLGQGFASAVGLAMAERHMAARFNRPGFTLFDNYTYVFCGDGSHMEGIVSEAASLAGHLKLNRLIVLYDDNKISIDGGTDLAFTEDVPKRFRAYGWNTITVKNADTDFNGIADALAAARASRDKPTLISFRTTIGFGAPNEGREVVHGIPLGAEHVKQVKKRFGFDPTRTFVVPDEVYGAYADVKPRGEKMVAAWNKMVQEYCIAHPKKGIELVRRLKGILPSDWVHQCKFPTFTPNDKKLPTRGVSNIALNCLAKVLPEFVGGSADLTPSNQTGLKGVKDFQAGAYDGRYFHYGVREHAMAAIGNGLSGYGAGFIPFCATFINFMTYAWGAVRVSALAAHQQIYVMTHDSIAVGEDGPTHQPIEVLVLCRSTPNVTVIRPADGNETIGAYMVAVNNRYGPTILALSRQDLPHLPHTSAQLVALGGYVVEEDPALPATTSTTTRRPHGPLPQACASLGTTNAMCIAPTFCSASSSTHAVATSREIVPQPTEKGKPDLILVATGSEVLIALQAAELFRKQQNLKVRVVSMPCRELFDRQPRAYRCCVLTPHVPVVSIEALSTSGWEKYAHYSIGMKSFGTAGPDQVVMDYFGFTGPKIHAKILKWLRNMKQKPYLLPVQLHNVPKTKHMHLRARL